MKIEFSKLKQNHQKSLSNSIREKLKVTNLQSYYPIYSLFMNFYNNSYSHKCFMMKSDFILKELINELGDDSKIKDGYIKFFYDCKLLNNENNTEVDEKVFIKMSPILDVVPYIMNEYNINHKPGLSNIFNYLANKKINSLNNSSYIDAFFSYLAGNMFENKLCPTFPLTYGTFSGIAETFDYDVTEEYSSIKRQDWYDEYNNKLFEIIKVENDYFSESGNSCKSLVCDDVENILDLEVNDNSDSNSDLDNLVNSEKNNKNRNIKKWLGNLVRTNSSNKRKRKLKNLKNIEENSNDADHSNNESDNERLVIDKESKKKDEESNESEQCNKLDESNKSDGESNKSDGESNKSDGESKESDEEPNESDGESNESDGESNKSDVQTDNLEVNIELDFENNSECSSNSNVDINNLNSFLNSDMESLSSSLDNISEDSSQFKFLKYVRVKNFPIQLIFMEILDKTLDELLDSDNYDMKDEEWLSILFQICFGLSVAQKHYNFVHNDLHSSNIMFKNTKSKYLYFNINNTYYKIPTFGKITKIIDFGRATFKIKNKIFFSDVFKKNGDAEGQYSYPYHNNASKGKVKTNPSFDLARLSTTIIERLNEDTPLFNMVKEWSKDRYGNYLIYHNDNFELYKRISKTVETAIPKNQLKHELFQRFAIKQSKIPRKEFVFYY